MVCTANLMALQQKDGDCTRYDIFLRYLATKGVMDGSGDFKDEYMFMLGGLGKERYDRIPDLLESLKKKGFDMNCPIPIAKNWQLVNGAHRLAIALLLNIDHVSTEITKGGHMYTKNRMRKIGFNDQFIALLDKEKDKIYEQKGIYFPVILWPPAEKYFHDIASDIRKQFRVVKEELLSVNNMSEFMRKIYSTDDVTLEVMEKKIAAVTGNSVYHLLIEIPKPSYKIKLRTGGQLSRTGMDLKKQIRDKYKARVPNYIHDIICHTGDNYQHNAEITKILGGLKC